MNNKILNKAANDYALKVLGEEQFKKNPDAKKSIKEDFIEGAKWQQERMYSEDEVLAFANWCRIEDNKNTNRIITIQQLFEQYYNETYKTN